MRIRWEALHESLNRSLLTLEQDKHFNTIKRSRPRLKGFEDTASLLNFFADPKADLDRKDLIYADLVQLARSDGDEAEMSRTLLWLGLWPGLDGIYRRNVKFHHGQPEELVSALGAHFMRCVEKADLTRIDRVAATLLRNTQRQLREERMRRLEHDNVLDPLPEHDEPINPEREIARPGESYFGLPPGIDTDESITRLRRLIQQMVQGRSTNPDLDAELVIRVAILGEDGREAGRNLGLTGDQGRKRYQRAISRVREAIRKKHKFPCPTSASKPAFPHQTGMSRRRSQP